MNSLAQLKQKIVEYLGGLAAFENVVVLSAFPEKQRAYPPKSPVIAVGFAGVELEPAGLGGYLGARAANGALQYGAAALVTLRFGVFGPDAAACDALYESLANALFDAAWVNIQKLSCAQVGYDAKNAAYLLPVEAVLKAAWLLQKNEERLFASFELKEMME